MPKEKVYDQVKLYDATVGWRPDGYVQVGIESHEGIPLSKLLSGPDGESPADFTGLWGTFDRDGCNRLIRAIRKARDSAYGADA
jgi:hypothetical protein